MTIYSIGNSESVYFWPRQLSLLDIYSYFLFFSFLPHSGLRSVVHSKQKHSNNNNKSSPDDVVTFE